MSLDSIEFQQISDGFDIGIIPSERIENRVYGYMRLKPSALKEAASAEYNTVNKYKYLFVFGLIESNNFYLLPTQFFYIFNGEIVLNADSNKWELIGGDTFRVKAGK